MNPIHFWKILLQVSFFFINLQIQDRVNINNHPYIPLHNVVAMLWNTNTKQHQHVIEHTYTQSLKVRLPHKKPLKQLAMLDWEPHNQHIMEKQNPRSRVCEEREKKHTLCWNKETPFNRKRRTMGMR